MQAIGRACAYGSVLNSTGHDTQARHCVTVLTDAQTLTVCCMESICSDSCCGLLARFVLCLLATSKVAQVAVEIW